MLSLSGVGEYATDAVLCFAYGRDVIVVDANVCRVMERLFGLKPRGEGEPLFQACNPAANPQGKRKRVQLGHNRLCRNDMHAEESEM